MTIARIHVNQHVIRSNRQRDEHEPPLRVKERGNNYAADEVEIYCPRCTDLVATVIYRPDKPLSCGARCWIETTTDAVQVLQRYGTSGARLRIRPAF